MPVSPCRRMRPCVRHLLLPILALLVLGACASKRGAEPTTPDTPAAEAPPSSTPPPASSPPASSPPPDAPAGLDELGRSARDGTLTARGLTGANKPNGLDERFRRWVPPETPAYVPRRLDSLTLALADPVEGGWLALYESPLEALGPNRTYRAVLFDAGGGRRWDLPLNPFLSRPTQLEIQDLRYRDGKLYFNEACQTYAREADGACSALLRVDPATRRVEWRTPPLTSNDVFILHGPYVVAGYGFTAEPDYLHLIEAATGRIVERVPLDSAHDYLEVQGDVLHVITYNSAYTFRLPPASAP